ncbi:MAG: RnfABCDGE type electron transport complex subunit G [Candidatus Rokubacteria bacterium]|nr:RnfABCDGE type electron transport complex subunit G [Candidatus Rokubacteria bacterium]
MTAGDGPAASATVPEAPAPPAVVKTTSLLTTLGAGGVIAGVLLVVVYSLTLPAIEANKQKDLEAAIKEVLKGAERYETLYVVGGALVAKAPDGADPKKLEPVYLGYRAGNERAGFALAAAEPGFQDLVGLIFGYDAAKKQLLGMKVLESKETPGLGDKIAKDQTFVGQFRGAATPLVGVKQGKRSKPGEVDMITGATISSKAVIRIINNTLKRLGPAVEAYAAEGTR